MKTFPSTMERSRQCLFLARKTICGSSTWVPDALVSDTNEVDCSPSPSCSAVEMRPTAFPSRVQLAGNAHPTTVHTGTTAACSSCSRFPFSALVLPSRVRNVFNYQTPVGLKPDSVFWDPIKGWALIRVTKKTVNTHCERWTGSPFSPPGLLPVRLSSRSVGWWSMCVFRG